MIQSIAYTATGTLSSQAMTRALRTLRNAGMYCAARSEGPGMSDRLDYHSAYLLIWRAYESLMTEGQQ